VICTFIILIVLVLMIIMKKKLKVAQYMYKVDQI